MSRVLYKDRRAAGQALAEALSAYRGRPEVLVLGLPRGGVPVAVEVAQALHAELDVVMVRKLGLPTQRELAMGGIASGGVCLRNERVIMATGVPPDVFEEVEQVEREELLRRERDYRGTGPLPAMGGRTVILVDDGLATGSTMRAAVAAVRKFHPAEIVAAVPVGAAISLDELRSEADTVVCPAIQEQFVTTARFYGDFLQVSDEEACALLRRARGDRQPEAALGKFGDRY